MPTNNKNSRINRFFRDEEIENANSFEEARAIIVSRLNNLHVDLYARVPGEEAMLNEILKAHKDKFQGLMDIYAGFYSPCKVADTSFQPRGQADMNDIMIDFSEGFEKFIESLEERYVEMIIARRRATELLGKMLSLKLPFSQLLYLYYYKRVHPEDVFSLLFFSRATFYRMKGEAITELTRMYYPYNKNKDNNNDNDKDNAMDNAKDNEDHDDEHNDEDEGDCEETA